VLARPTENLARLSMFRGINPLYAVFLVNQLGIADRNERVQAMESVLEVRRLFDYDFPGVRDLRTSPVWAAGELLQFGGDFNQYVTSKSLQKQEGMIFRHALRLILLVNEFVQVCPPDTT